MKNRRIQNAKEIAREFNKIFEELSSGEEKLEAINIKMEKLSEELENSETELNELIETENIYEEYPNYLDYSNTNETSNEEKEEINETNEYISENQETFEEEAVEEELVESNYNDSLSIENTKKFKINRYFIISIILIAISIGGIYMFSNRTKEEKTEDLKLATQDFNISDIKEKEDEIIIEDTSNISISDNEVDSIDNKTGTVDNKISDNYYDNRYSEIDDKYSKDTEEIDRAISELEDTSTVNVNLNKPSMKSGEIGFINKNNSKNKNENENNTSTNQQSNDLYFYNKNDELNENYNINRIKKSETIYTVNQGSLIPAILLTEVNTDLPGNVLAQVRENVYDTRSGKYLLIPKGSRLYGRYESSVERGQNRVFLVWDKIVLPNGKYIDISSFAGADNLGNSGVSDKTNNHTLSLVGNALLSSVLNLGDTLTSGVSFSVAGITVGLNGNKKEGEDSKGDSPFKKVTSKLVDQEANRKPTITIRRGFKFNIIVNGDLILEKYKY